MVGVEKKRNSVGPTFIFASNRNLLSNTLLALYDRAASVERNMWISASSLRSEIVMAESANVFGYVNPYPTGNASDQPAPLKHLPPLTKVLLLYFSLLNYNLDICIGWSL